MANEEHLNILENSTLQTWMEWRKKNLNIIPDLSGADLTKVSLRKYDLSKSKLCGVTLADDLTQIDFSVNFLPGYVHILFFEVNTQSSF